MGARNGRRLPSRLPLNGLRLPLRRPIPAGQRQVQNAAMATDVCLCVRVPVLIATPKKCLAIRANGPFPSTLGSKVGMHIRRLARSMTHGASWERWVNTGTHCGPTQGPTASAPQGPRMCADQSNAGEFSMRHPPSSKTAHLQNPALLTSRTPHSSKTPSQR